MKQKTLIIIITASLLLLTSCLLFESKPEVRDGNLSLRLNFTYPSEIDSSIQIPVNELPVKVYTNDFNLPVLYDTTDSNGCVNFDNLPYAHYNVEAYKIIWTDVQEAIEFVGASEYYFDIDSMESNVKMDTLELIKAKGGLKINEIYTVGPPNNIFYFYDQYFELYNGFLTKTVYLDGMIFLRLSRTELFADTLAVTNIYQFPGTPITGREYPIEPGEFVVLAGKAMNHNLIGPIAGRTVDLSNADWEFLNLIEAGAYDNPNVPNLTTNNGKVTQSSRVDFMVGLSGDGLALCDGTDYDQSDGIDINTVVDCVEYSSSETHTKEVPYSLDASFGGIGLTKYSSESLERIRPGFDTNNSRVDFVIINQPTPGYQHE